MPYTPSRIHRALVSPRLLGGVAALILGSAAPVLGCQSTLNSKDRRLVGETPVAAPLNLPRLTAEQYRNAATDLLGVNSANLNLEPDSKPHLYSSIGASLYAASDRGIRLYQTAAQDAANAVFADESKRSALIGCEINSISEPCASDFVRRFGSLAFRRPLTSNEHERYLNLAKNAAQAAGSGQAAAHRGLQAVVQAFLQSPNFIYRLEQGSKVEESRRLIRGHEMASRLAFLYWNAPPDAALLQAAAEGKLDSPEGIRAELPRLYADARTRRAVRGFFREYLGLDALSDLDRSTDLYPTWKPELAASMRQEVERAVEYVIFEEAGDFRQVFNTRFTFVDQPLATFYGLSNLQFGTQSTVRVELPESSPRRGILSMAGVLALNAHPNVTSPTRRGKYVRERILCGRIPDPPENVLLELAEDAGDGRQVSLRERLAEHRNNPSCANCHNAMDPIGLGMEEFDPVGLFRESEHGMPIDNSGAVDDYEFRGVAELGETLRNDPRVPACVAKQVFRYATGRMETDGEAPSFSLIVRDFEDSGYHFDALLAAIAVSDAFRTVSLRLPTALNTGAQE